MKRATAAVRAHRIQKRVDQGLSTEEERRELAAYRATLKRPRLRVAPPPGAAPPPPPPQVVASPPPPPGPPPLPLGSPESIPPPLDLGAAADPKGPAMPTIAGLNPGELTADMIADGYVQLLGEVSQYNVARGHLGLSPAFMPFVHGCTKFMAQSWLAEHNVDPKKVARIVVVGSGAFVGWEAYRAHTEEQERGPAPPKPTDKEPHGNAEPDDDDGPQPERNPPNPDPTNAVF